MTLKFCEADFGAAYTRGLVRPALYNCSFGGDDLPLKIDGLLYIAAIPYATDSHHALFYGQIVPSQRVRCQAHQIASIQVGSEFRQLDFTRLESNLNIQRRPIVGVYHVFSEKERTNSKQYDSNSDFSM
ncbi:MAG: hypothetical protein WCA19_24435 [Candidatus Acidiferrales bacterium]